MTTTSVRSTVDHAWHTVVLDGTRLQYVRVAGQWKPILDVWFRVNGQWIKQTSYSPQLAAPANLRLNPVNAGNHSTIPVIWDYTVGAGQLAAGDFVLVLTDENGGWLQWPVLNGATRSYTFTGLTQGKKYKVALTARYPGTPDGSLNQAASQKGRPDTPWIWLSDGQPRNGWQLGSDASSYTVPIGDYDAPYGWLPNNIVWAGSWDGQHPPQQAIDGNFGTQWLSGTDPNGPGGSQGDGFRIQLAGYIDRAQRQLLGVQVWIPGYGGPSYPSDPRTGNTVWYGVYQNGAWQGGQWVFNGRPDNGNMAPLAHAYMAGQGPTTLVNMYSNGGPAPGQGSTGIFRTDIYNDMSVDLLFQFPDLYPGWGTPGRYGAWEVRLVFQDWNPNHSSQTVNVAAVNSGWW